MLRSSVKGMQKYSDGRNAVMLAAKEENYKTVGAAAGLAYKQIVGAESADDINLAKQLNVLLTQLGVDAKSIVMNVGTAAAGYGYRVCSFHNAPNQSSRTYSRVMRHCRCRLLLR